MAGTKSQGSRIYYATAATSWTPLAAGAYPASPWVEVTRGVDADTKPHEVEKNDNSCLNDTSPSPEVILKPGTISFSREKDSQSPTLRGFCDAQTAKAWAEVFVDGTAEYCASGILTCTSAGKAARGFANRVIESYEVTAAAIIVNEAHA